VLLRGRGIVALRLIERLYAVHRMNANVRIVHLLRTRKEHGKRFRRNQRPVRHQFEMQPFNWPKATWGGELRLMLERADVHERVRLLGDWGGTTVPPRRAWMAILEEGQRAGWYRVIFGDIGSFDRSDRGQIIANISGEDGGERPHRVAIDYVLDATGLEADLSQSPLLQDLTGRYELAINDLGRFAVTDAMEVSGMRNRSGRFYAAGALTLGGPIAGVDSFLGLQAAAQLSVEDLVQQGAPGVHPLGPLRSIWQWSKWMRGITP
jgi:hypothetical protein